MPLVKILVMLHHGADNVEMPNEEVSCLDHPSLGSWIASGYS
jgi:hypothetical protein